MAIKKSDLYSSLWASCDELRGGMDASQYKDYVLFMLFIKYISDKYGDSDDFSPSVTIPKGASFKDMVALRGASDIGDKINKQVIQRLIDANSRLARSDFPDFNDPNKLGDGAARVETLSNLIAIFQKPELDFSRNRAEHDDIINNVRKTIIRDQLTDPKFYEEMSKLLDDLIVLKRSITESDEEFLKQAEALVLRMAGKVTQGTHPTVLNGYPEGLRSLNNLASIPAVGFQCPTDEEEKAKLALEIRPRNEGVIPSACVARTARHHRTEGPRSGGSRRGATSNVIGRYM